MKNVSESSDIFCMMMDLGIPRTHINEEDGLHALLIALECDITPSRSFTDEFDVEIREAFSTVPVPPGGYRSWHGIARDLAFKAQSQSTDKVRRELRELVNLTLNTVGVENNRLAQFQQRI